MCSNVGLFSECKGLLSRNIGLFSQCVGLFIGCKEMFPTTHRALCTPKKIIKDYSVTTGQHAGAIQRHLCMCRNVALFLRLFKRDRACLHMICGSFQNVWGSFGKITGLFLHDMGCFQNAQITNEQPFSAMQRRPCI